MCGQGDLLDLKNEEYVVFLISFQGRAQLLLTPVPLQGSNSHGAHLSPVSLQQKGHLDMCISIHLFVRHPEVFTTQGSPEKKKHNLKVEHSVLFGRQHWGH